MEERHVEVVKEAYIPAGERVVWRAQPGRRSGRRQATVTQITESSKSALRIIASASASCESGAPKWLVYCRLPSANSESVRTRSAGSGRPTAR
jgi:hypothetical protein